VPMPGPGGRLVDAMSTIMGDDFPARAEADYLAKAGHQMGLSLETARYHATRASVSFLTSEGFTCVNTLADPEPD
jgi:hypothetical protein